MALVPLAGWIRDNCKDLEKDIQSSSGRWEDWLQDPVSGKAIMAESVESDSFFYDSELSFLLFQLLHVVLGFSPSSTLLALLCPSL